jgi:hypothetical protein
MFKTLAPSAALLACAAPAALAQGAARPDQLEFRD